eukprot:4186501-Amphidinium_carterae.1
MAWASRLALSVADREEILAAVQQDGLALRTAAESCRSDRVIVLAAVQQNALALQFAAESCRSDHEIVLAAVQQSGKALQHAAESCRSDQEIVLAAVQQDIDALKYAAENCRSDRKIVLAAVKQQWYAGLFFAGEWCRGDQEIMLTAVKLNSVALPFASDALLEDTSFAADTKKSFHMLKISLMSGRYTCVAATFIDNTERIITLACARLALRCCGSERLVQGTSVVGAQTAVHDWPGVAPLGEITEYQLIV